MRCYSQLTLNRILKSLSLSGSSDSLGLRSRLLRKINGLKAQQSNSEAPDEFLCPITRELMKDPVMAAGWTSSSFLFNLHFLNVIFRHIFVKTRVRPTDGFSYERESMEGWIRGKNKTSPMTNLPLLTTLLTPNRSLKMAIERWTSGQQTRTSLSAAENTGHKVAEMVSCIFIHTHIHTCGVLDCGRKLFEHLPLLPSSGP